LILYNNLLLREIYLPPIVSCSVVIGAKLGREDYGSILATAIGRRLKPLDARTDS
jgi:hypothetical protein